MKVVILGASGMLGSMLLDVLARDPALQLRVVARNAAFREAVATKNPRLEVFGLDAETCDFEQVRALLAGSDWAVNAIGLIKQHMQDDTPETAARAAKINAAFPALLAQAAAATGCRVLQIATDCVFSGRKGGYLEDSPHDPVDAYGRSKSLGEVRAPGMFHLRCSIIGPEPRAHVSLLDWFLGQPTHARVTGFSNHLWNGLSTLHFARICRGVMASDLTLPHLQHVVPQGALSKLELLRCFARAFARPDLEIVPGSGAESVDRTLATGEAALNEALWRAAGYASPPSIAQMVDELAQHLQDSGPASPQPTTSEPRGEQHR